MSNILNFEEFQTVLGEDTNRQEEMRNLRLRIVELRKKASRLPSARKELEAAEAHLGRLMKLSTL